jgi:mycofactocin glycosyltransferase
MRDTRTVSVIIPARNEATGIGRVVEAVLAQREPGLDLEVIVVDDGSIDGTAEAAEAAGARVLRLPEQTHGGNPAAARNRGARAATGEIAVFLDADCTPAPRWLGALVTAHDRGDVVVGGALDIPSGLTRTAQWDYYASSYHMHSRQAAGYVANHSPANLSVRRSLFLQTQGFTEQLPVADGHEELAWQGELLRAGHRLRFEPLAVVYHRNRPGFTNLLRRNYRWGYSSIESKTASGAARLSWLYRHPRLLVAAAVPLAPVHALHTLSCWVRAGIWRPVLMLPALFAAKFAYAVGMAVGGTRWLSHHRAAAAPLRPRWR